MHILLTKQSSVVRILPSKLYFRKYFLSVWNMNNLLGVMLVCHQCQSNLTWALIHFTRRKTLGVSKKIISWIILGKTIYQRLLVIFIMLIILSSSSGFWWSRRSTFKADSKSLLRASRLDAILAYSTKSFQPQTWPISRPRKS